MTFAAALLIVLSVMFHAAWNLIAKKSVMTISFYGMLSFYTVIVMSNVLIWTPVRYRQLPPEFYATLVLTVTFDTLYGYGLSHSYRKLDMSCAYPVMRSLPLLLTMPLSVMLGGAPLPWHTVAGMLIAFSGCLLMPLERFRDFDWKFYFSRDMLFILVAACGTTGYTLMDSRAQALMRASFPDCGRPVISLSYYAIRCVFLCSCLALCNLAVPGDRRTYLGLLRKLDWHPLLAALAAVMAYVLVLMAMNHVDNVTYVQMLRLLALPAGLFAGIFILREKGAAPKFTGVALILAGMALTALPSGL